MSKGNNRTANSAVGALEILWKERFFDTWRNFKSTRLSLEDRGNTFPKPELAIALRQAKYLTRSGKKGDYKYRQKFPATKEDAKAVDSNRSNYEYVNSKRLKELESIDNSKFDLSRLIESCQEINITFNEKAYLAVPLLVRSIIDQVPPVFGFKTFGQVANNYGPKSFKDSTTHLENSSRKIADSYLHTPIRSKEALPNGTQVNFANDLDVLLQEIFRLLK